MSRQRDIVLSGIQPTGELHIGNVVGALRHWVELQNTHECLFPVVDLHAITVRQDPADLRRRCLDFAAQYLACGIDPKQSSVFIQSHVGQHAELAWILGCFTQFGELSRMTQFKDKSSRKPDNVNAGLFTYPVLMAADILLYDTSLVPVGADQIQHLELTRNVAQRFNQAMGESFRVPEKMTPKVGARVMSLADPTAKMSKTDEDVRNFVAVLDAPEKIRKKFRRAKTDTEGVVAYDEARPGISNLMSIHSAFSGESFESLQQRFEGKGYGHFKDEVADVVIEHLTPIRERYEELRSDEGELSQVLAKGATRARELARQTVTRIYDKLGFVPQTS